MRICWSSLRGSLNPSYLYRIGVFLHITPVSAALSHQFDAVFTELTAETVQLYRLGPRSIRGKFISASPLKTVFLIEINTRSPGKASGAPDGVSAR